MKHSAALGNKALEDLADKVQREAERLELIHPASGTCRGKWLEGHAAAAVRRQLTLARRHFGFSDARDNAATLALRVAAVERSLCDPLRHAYSSSRLACQAAPWLSPRRFTK